MKAATFNMGVGVSIDNDRVSTESDSDRVSTGAIATGSVQGAITTGSVPRAIATGSVQGAIATGSVQGAIATGSVSGATGLQVSLLDRGEMLIWMWNDTDVPLAYLISFRGYGTWLHGDERGSIDRHHNRYKSPYIEPNPRWHRHNTEVLDGQPVILDARQRKSVERAIRTTCHFRK